MQRDPLQSLTDLRRTGTIHARLTHDGPRQGVPGNHLEVEMTANSLGRTLIGVLGIWFLCDGILLVVQMTIGGLGFWSGIMGETGLVQSIQLFLTLAQLLVVPLIGLVLIVLRGQLADRLFGQEEAVSLDTSARDLMALFLLGLGIWFLVVAIQNTLSFVEWGPTPYGFPFRFGEYPANYWVFHLLQGVLGIGFIFKCGWIAQRLTKVLPHE